MIKLVFVGDFYATNPNLINADKSLVKLIRNSDYAICNFEGAIQSEFKPIVKSGPSIAQSKDSVNWLKNTGFNIFTFGNNHSMDYGENALKNTLNYFDEQETLGAGDFQNAYKLLKLNKNGIKIGLLSLCQYEFGMSISSSQNFGVAWINDPIVNDIIQSSKRDVDYLIILPHAGVENIDIPLPEWRQRYHNFIDLGADAVIGGHPHVPQGKETYKGRPIYYSLGNFFFEKMNDSDIRHKQSIVVTLNINKDMLIEDDYSIVERKDYNLYLKNNNTSQNIMSQLTKKISDNNIYYDEINSIVNEMWNRLYKQSLYYSLRKFTLKYGIKFCAKMIIKSILRRSDYPLLLNDFQCESHRWIIQRALSNIISKQS